MLTLEQLQATEKELKDAIKYLEAKFTDYALRTGEIDTALQQAITSLRTSLMRNQLDIEKRLEQIEREKRLLEEQYVLFAMGYDALHDKLQACDISPSKARHICAEIYKDFLQSTETQPFKPLYGDLVEYIEDNEAEIDAKYFPSLKNNLTL